MAVVVADGVHGRVHHPAAGDEREHFGHPALAEPSPDRSPGRRETGHQLVERLGGQYPLGIEDHVFAQVLQRRPAALGQRVPDPHGEHGCRVQQHRAHGEPGLAQRQPVHDRVQLAGAQPFQCLTRERLQHLDPAGGEASFEALDDRVEPRPARSQAE